VSKQVLPAFAVRSAAQFSLTRGQTVRWMDGWMDGRLCIRAPARGTPAQCGLKFFRAYSTYVHQNDPRGVEVEQPQVGAEEWRS
jgi:hypothetical protein